MGCKMLEQEIKRKIKIEVEKYRQNVMKVTTNWTESFETIFKDMLEECEKSLNEGGNPNVAHQLSEMLQRYGKCRFNGSPFWKSCRSKFTKERDISIILKELLRRNVHKNEENNVSFALILYIHPYPHDVNVVWVFLASIENLEK